MDFEFEEREQDQITACMHYYEYHRKSGLPGHSIFVLVAKLWQRLQSMVQAYYLLQQERFIMIGMLSQVFEVSNESIEDLVRITIRKMHDETTDVEDSPQAADA